MNINIQSLIASGAWGLVMGAVITPAAGLTPSQNLIATIAGALIITMLFHKE